MPAHSVSVINNYASVSPSCSTVFAAQNNSDFTLHFPDVLQKLFDNNPCSQFHAFALACYNVLKSPGNGMSTFYLWHNRLGHPH